MIRVWVSLYWASAFLQGYGFGAGTGPICYSCPRTDNPEDCRVSVTCSSEQVCSVQEITAPHGDVYFWSGCEDLEICAALSESSTSQTIVGKRQVSVDNHRCIYCCSGELCNKNCTTFVNLALHKPAYESSLYPGGNASHAVDGNTEKDWYQGSCTHNLINEHYPWWAVDLQHEYHITKVKIYERLDSGAADGRSIHLRILVSSYNATAIDRNSGLFTECRNYYGHSSEGNTIVIDCPKNTIGRWVRIQQNDPNIEYLHLCEVEVFGF